jgi:hypothetical protein
LQGVLRGEVATSSIIGRLPAMHTIPGIRVGDTAYRQRHPLEIKL